MSSDTPEAAEPAMRRKLTAILAADAVGYSKSMSHDEERTLRVLAGHRRIIDGLIIQYEGRLVGTAGDSVLAEFGSSVAAVRCAVDIQEALKTRNEALDPDQRMDFRMGINLGDVVISGDDILGDGVNVAARLESIAQPGGIAISSSVFDQIAGKLNLGFVDRGEQALKNISRPIRVYQLGYGNTPLAAEPSAGAQATEPRSKRPQLIAVSVLGLAGAITLGVLVMLRSPSPTPKPAAPGATAAPSTLPAVSTAAPTAPFAPPEPLASDRIWRAEFSCDAFAERPPFSMRFDTIEREGRFIVTRGIPSAPGYLSMVGQPDAAKRLTLEGTLIAGSKANLGKILPARFEGTYAMDRYVLTGQQGNRSCSLLLSRNRE